MRVAEIHAVTREFADAASAKTPDAEVAVRIELNASDQDPNSADHLNISLRVSSEDNYRPSIAHILQALGRVATRHGLTQRTLLTRDGILFSYSRSDYVTHYVHIRTSVAESSHQLSPDNPAGSARLAIILDDVGTDRAVADVIFALPYPLTLSVLPNRPHSVDIAEEAHRRGYQVMLHLPMQSVGNGKAEPQELRRGMGANELAALVDEFLRAVPEVTGVNNHQGSESTADAALMKALMPVLRERRLFYIDSRTTKETVAYEAAREAGVRCASRNVPFLDDVPGTSAVRKQLELALHGAKETGEAVAIGHPHATTLAALKEVLPQAKALGVQLVFASDLVH